MLYPDDQVLVDYASGAISPGLGLLVATHLTFSPESRRRVADLELIGGLLIENEPSPNIPPPALSAALDRLDAVTRFEAWEPEAHAEAPLAAARPSVSQARGATRTGPMLHDLHGRSVAEAREDEAASVSGKSPVLPARLRDFAGGDVEDLDWRFRLPGLSECTLSEGEGEEISLIRARPGAPTLSHTHSGVETTLVLCGQLEDRGRIYRRGDVAIATVEDDHRPRIVGDEVCICLVVMSGEMRFTGAMSRVLNLLA